VYADKRKPVAVIPVGLVLAREMSDILSMTSDERRLVRHLAIAVALKLVVLSGLWWGFVRDERVSVDAEAASAHIGAPRPPTGEAP
jgi:hypothetical protein